MILSINKNFARYSDRQDANISLNEAVGKYMAKWSNCNSPIDYITQINSDLVDNIDYTLTAKNAHNVIGSLVDGECVCDGYAKAFQLLSNLTDLGYDAAFVSGTGTNSSGNSESHAWNAVNIDDVWYYIDVTWNDPFVNGSPNNGGKYKKNYFLKGKTDFTANHTEEN
jgi:transglutaminase/protease-like cytokinesis protein 3